MPKSKAEILSKKHLFIEYANNPLQNSRENFNQIVDVIKDEFGALPAVGGLPSSMLATYGYRLKETMPSLVLRNLYSEVLRFGQDINEAIIERGRIRTTPPNLGKINRMGSFEKDFLYMHGESAITAVQLAEWNTKEIHIDSSTEIGFEAAYSFLDGACYESGLKSCPTYNPWVDNLDLDVLQRTPHIKCYECQLLAFVEILNKIISGKAYTEIPGLEDLLHLGLSSYRRTLSINGADQLETMMGWRSSYDDQTGHFLPGPDPDYPFKHTFNHLLLGFVSHSLGTFLADPKFSRTRLHKCEICGDFFIDEPRAKQCPSPKDCRQIRKTRYQKHYMRKKRNLDSPEGDEKYIK
jgi:hypothetical protein